MLLAECIITDIWGLGIQQQQQQLYNYLTMLEVKDKPWLLHVQKLWSVEARLSSRSQITIHWRKTSRSWMPEMMRNTLTSASTHRLLLVASGGSLSQVHTLHTGNVTLPFIIAHLLKQLLLGTYKPVLWTVYTESIEEGLTTVVGTHMYRDLVKKKMEQGWDFSLHMIVPEFDKIAPYC